jgi:hypothetical protein
MDRWKLRIILGLAIATFAVVFPWWVWMSLLIITSVWERPYWEGVFLAFFFDIIYSGGLSGVGFFTIGTTGVKFWMLYMAFFIILLFIPNRGRRQVY